MSLSLAEKIIQEHIVKEACPDLVFQKGQKIKAGTPIALHIDQTLTQDATGTLVYLELEAINPDKLATDLSVSYIDHNTLQTDYKNHDDHLFLQTVAQKYGVVFSRAGNGICHQVHLERFSRPGATLLGSDSHTPTAGAAGMIAIGAGGLDVATAMAGGAFHLTMPKIINVHLTGKLRPGVSAKDVILEVLKRQTVKGGLGCIYEYTGAGVKNLSLTQRATITNMGAELGATTSVFATDENTKHFFDLQNRMQDFKEIKADENAIYDKTIEIDMGCLEPLAACPHSPDNVKAISQLKDIKVSQVAIGSCTNSSLEDLAKVAAVLRGKKVSPFVEAAIAPGSRSVLRQAMKAGIMEDIVKSGFRVLESACGPCIGMGFAPNTQGVSLRTFNRNFKGRSGTKDANLYLVSPETAAASAIAGYITSATNVTSLQQEWHDYIKNNLHLQDIKDIAQDTNLFIFPKTKQKDNTIQVIKGPNIKEFPQGVPIKDSLVLKVLLKAGDNVSTDDIMPAGTKVLPLRSNIPEISKFAFWRLDSNFYENCQKQNFCDSVVIGGQNYGQGSSREHAALAPMYLGVKVILSKSFARIHHANLINYGIIPMTFANESDYDLVANGDSLAIDNIIKTLETSQEFKVVVTGQNGKKQITCKTNLAPRDIQILKAGSLILYTKNGGL